MVETLGCLRQLTDRGGGGGLEKGGHLNKDGPFEIPGGGGGEFSFKSYLSAGFYFSPLHEFQSSQPLAGFFHSPGPPVISNGPSPKFS